MIQKTLKLSHDLLSGKTENIKRNVRDVYTVSAGLYFTDYVVWSALFVDPQHIFYKPLDDPNW